MNVVTRGVKNALRNPVRSGIIVLILAISIGLVLSMLVAKGSIEAKIAEVKATAGTSITITPAGIQGFAGGGEPLVAEDVNKIISTDHVVSSVETLSDQADSDSTNLESSLELGSLGQRFRQSGGGSTEELPGVTGSDIDISDFTPPITVTGTTNINSVSTDGGELTISSGETIDAEGSELVALVGSNLAEKNNLSVGDTFTLYDKSITVSGIFTTDNQFQDNGLIMPLESLQILTEHDGAVTSITATVDSSDHVEATVSSLKATLGDNADITSDISRAESSVESLESIANLAVAGVIGSAIAGAIIILFTMIIVIRERRREIGVMKAIGGTNIKVVGQFMWESLTLTFLGMVFGLALGVAVSGPMTSSLVTSSSDDPSTQTGPMQGGPGGFVRQGFGQINSNITNVTSVMTPQMFAAALGITLAIGLIGGAVPAWFISRIRPAEVLRTE
jgi:putative ABC transport system permease protein